MNPNHIRTRKAIARTAVVGIATGVAALALAGPASADHTLLDETIIVSDCHSSGEECGVVPTFTFFAPDHQVRVTFIGGDGCSTIAAHTVIDGDPNTGQTSFVDPHQSKWGDEPVKLGFHKITVETGGVLGGCNTGRLASYSGRLLIDSIED
jgi:hypothetical protein